MSPKVNFLYVFFLLNFETRRKKPEQQLFRSLLSLDSSVMIDSGANADVTGGHFTWQLLSAVLTRDDVARIEILTLFDRNG
jgi:hypothetical protein